MALTTRPFVSHFPRHHDERGRQYMKRTTVLNRREFTRFCLSASGYAMTAGSSKFWLARTSAIGSALTVKARHYRLGAALGTRPASAWPSRQPRSEGANGSAHSAT